MSLCAGVCFSHGRDPDKRGGAMTRVDVLVVGQGICGTFLSWELDRAGLSYIVIDEDRPASASRAAAGLINPVTGRRFVKTWMIDELLPFVRVAYDEALLRPVEVLDFFPTAQMRLAFVKRCEEGGEYVRLAQTQEEHKWDALFRYELGYGVIDSCYLVDLRRLLTGARRELNQRGVLRGECLGGRGVGGGGLGGVVGGYGGGGGDFL